MSLQIATALALTPAEVAPKLAKLGGDLVVRNSFGGHAATVDARPTHVPDAVGDLARFAAINIRQAKERLRDAFVLISAAQAMDKPFADRALQEQLLVDEDPSKVRELLGLLGISAADMGRIFGEDQSNPYVAAAKTNHAREGEIEIDERAIVSMADGPDPDGAYVLAWLWISKDEVLANG